MFAKLQIIIIRKLKKNKKRCVLFLQEITVSEKGHLRNNYNNKMTKKIKSKKMCFVVARNKCVRKRVER